MPGRTSDSTVMQYLGAAVALVAILGVVGLDWEFGATGDTLPFALGIGCVVVAVGWLFYRRQ